jgi:hypothetical protein
MLELVESGIGTAAGSWSKRLDGIYRLQGAPVSPP